MSPNKLQLHRKKTLVYPLSNSLRVAFLFSLSSAAVASKEEPPKNALIALWPNTRVVKRNGSIRTTFYSLLLMNLPIGVYGLKYLSQVMSVIEKRQNGQISTGLKVSSVGSVGFNRAVGWTRSISTVGSVPPTGQHGRYRRSVRLHLRRITVDIDGQFGS